MSKGVSMDGSAVIQDPSRKSLPEQFCNTSMDKL